MATRGYKLQEFLAHSTNVNCLSIGKKTSRLLITGGDDHKVNLWAIGNPTSLMTLCGHMSAVDSVAFDTAEVLVAAGASTGVIKLWDLEEAKMIRGLTGHRSNCTAVEFHPFGEFFASGSMDTNLKIWDIRKKGCIHTYKGHIRGINTIRFTPDGRWVVSGGLDNVVKVWDLTAGKLLHEFKFLEGHIRSIDFHPLEFLLATGSADRTVKFWDLETFELIGSSRPESSGVRKITFHPDGRTLFCGLDDNLKVYSWEPVVCHDGVDVGWSTLGDLCINEGKLLGCSYYQNSVGVWVADISLIQPYRVGSMADKDDCIEKPFSLPGNQPSERLGNGTRPISTMCSVSPDYDTKEIKNIYIDCGNSAAAQKPESVDTPKVILLLESQKVSNVENKKPNPTSTGQAGNKSLTVPSLLPEDDDVGKDSLDSKRESITFSRTKPGMLLRPAHILKTPTKFNETMQLAAVQSGIQSNDKIDGSDSEKQLDSQSEFSSDGRGRQQCVEEDSTRKCITDKFQKSLPLEPPSDEVNCMPLKPQCIQRSPNTKYNKARQAVTVDSGFQNGKRSGPENSKDPEVHDKLNLEDRDRKPSDEEDSNAKSDSSKFRRCVSPKTPSDEVNRIEPLSYSSDLNSVKIVRGVMVVSGRTRSLVERFERGEKLSGSEEKAVTLTVNQPTSMSSDELHVKPTEPTEMTLDKPQRSPTRPTNITSDQPRATPIQPTNMKFDQFVTSTRATNMTSGRAHVVATRCINIASDQPQVTPSQPTQMTLDQPIMPTPATKVSSDQPCVTPMRYNTSNQPQVITNQPTATTPDQPYSTPSLSHHTIPSQKEEPKVSGRDTDGEITEHLMQSHDTLLSTLQSRLTKLQVVRHYWGRNDIKGAIGTLRKLLDHSVQADVISVLMEKTQILTLDVFSSLLPVLSGLLNSKTERQANVSLEMLLKLVAVFGPMIHSMVSAPRVVGVDVHAEQRLKICNVCFKELQNIQKMLPELTRRGGLIAKKAKELNLVLQQP